MNWRACLAEFKNVEVVPFPACWWSGCAHGSHVLRGLRVFRFEYEFQMALTNRKLAPNIETLFLMPNEDFSYVSSSMVKEIAALGGDARQLVPPVVAAALKKKLAHS